MRVRKQEPPWRVIRAFPNESGEAVVHLHNVSGGILGGDDLVLEVEVERDGRAQLTTTGATRIYHRKPDQAPAMQKGCFHIADGALLEYLPDAVIPYAGSRFRQQSEFHLAPGAGLIAWEIVSAGRVSHGERFTFDEFTSCTMIQSLTRPLAVERYSLRPAENDLRSAARFGGFDYAASMWVCLVDDDYDGWIGLETDLMAMALELSSDDVLWGASTLAAHGLVVRGLAREAYLVTRGLQRFWSAAKQRVWGRAAIVPRRESRCI